MPAILSRFIALLFPLCAVSIHAAEPAFHVTRHDRLPGKAKWDYLTCNGGSKRLFIPTAILGRKHSFATGWVRIFSLRRLSCLQVT